MSVASSRAKRPFPCSFSVPQQCRSRGRKVQSRTQRWHLSEQLAGFYCLHGLRRSAFDKVSDRNAAAVRLHDYCLDPIQRAVREKMRNTSRPCEAAAPHETTPAPIRSPTAEYAYHIFEVRLSIYSLASRKRSLLPYNSFDMPASIPPERDYIVACFHFSLLWLFSFSS